MSDFDSNQYEGLEEDNSGMPPQGGGNRNFLIAVGIIAGIFLLAVIGLVAYLVLFVSPSNANKLSQATLISAQNQATANAATQTQAIVFKLMTPSATIPPTATTAPTDTPVIVLPSNTPEPTITDTLLPALAQDMTDRTATVAALLTQAAAPAQATLNPGTPSALPTTGIGDEIGLPGLFGIAVVLLAVIFLVRRMRVNGH